MKYKLSNYTRIINKDEFHEMIIYNTSSGKQSVIFDDLIKHQIKALVQEPREAVELDSRIVENY